MTSVAELRKYTHIHGIAADPTNTSLVLFASGHPKEDGNLGFMISRDAGKTWESLPSDLAAPDGFHHIAVIQPDPQTIFAADGGLHVSRDGGKTWQLAHARPSLATLVQAATDGSVFAFMPDAGLLRTKEPLLQ